jgi:hypothetical protein
LNSGPFPRPALPGVLGTTGLSATPGGPAWPSRASGWEPRTPTAWGFPCCVGSPCAGMPSPLPRWDHWSGSLRGGRPPNPPVTAAFPVFAAGRLLHRAFRGLLGVHSRYGLPARGIEGSGGFVTSTAAPSATGWSDRVAGRELHPLKIRAFPRRTQKPTLRRQALSDRVVGAIHRRDFTPQEGVTRLGGPPTAARLPDPIPRASSPAWSSAAS